MDNNLSPDEKLKVAKHLEECQECRLLYHELMDYQQLLNEAKNFDPQSVEAEDITQLEYKIMNTVQDEKEKETVFTRFWNSKAALALSYSSAAAVFVLITSLVINTYFIDNDDSNTFQTQYANLATSINDTSSQARINPPQAQDPKPLSYTFTVGNSSNDIRIIHEYVQSGEIHKKESDANFYEMQKLFGEISLKYGLSELRHCPECAKQYFDYIRSNKYLEGQLYLKKQIDNWPE